MEDVYKKMKIIFACIGVRNAKLEKWYRIVKVVLINAKIVKELIIQLN